MRRGLLAALMAPLLLLLSAPARAQDETPAPLILSKEASGPIHNTLLSLTLTARPECDQTAALIPNGSKLLSDDFALRVNTEGVGTFRGRVKIVTPENRIIVAGILQGVAGLTSRGAEDAPCRVPGHLEGTLTALPATTASGAVLDGPAGSSTPPVLQLSFSADALPNAGPVPAYAGRLDGLISLREPPAPRIRVLSEKPLYGPEERIRGVIHNASDRPIGVYSWFSYCTILQLQRKGETDWSVVAPCPLTGGPLIIIKPGEAKRVLLPPENQPAGKREPGAYRLALTYQFVNADGQVAGDPQQAVSEPFRVGDAPPLGRVTLMPNKPAYAVTEPVVAIIRNGLAVPIRAGNDGSWCTIVTMERKTETAWQKVGVCNAFRYEETEIPPGAEMRVPMQPDPATNAGWQPGVYRLSLAFRPVLPETPTTERVTVYSGPFSIGNIVPPTGSVTLSTNKRDYLPNEKVGFQVRNGLNVPIRAFDLNSFCSVLSVYRVTPSGRTLVVPCPLDRIPLPVDIAPGGSLLVPLPPGDSNFRWEPGPYVATLTFHPMANGTPGEARTIATEFRVNAEPPPTGRVILKPGKLSFLPSEPIVGLVANQTDATILTKTGESFCTILTLQRLVSNEWRKVAPCTLAQPAVMTSIAPGQMVRVVMPEVAIPEFRHEPGQYRLVLAYVRANADGTTVGDVVHVVSPIFTVTRLNNSIARPSGAGNADR